MTKVKPKNKTATNPVISFETFRKVGSYEQNNLKRDNPACFNGDVNIVKYKITIEPIEEPVEVYAGRLQQLWDECDNFRHLGPLKNAANQIGYELQGNLGSARKK